MLITVFLGSAVIPCFWKCRPEYIFFFLLRKEKDSPPHLILTKGGMILTKGFIL